MEADLSHMWGVFILYHEDPQSCMGRGEGEGGLANRKKASPAAAADGPPASHGSSDLVTDPNAERTTVGGPGVPM
ncbi:unnamed protein product [Merluccius merluccius]